MGFTYIDYIIRVIYYRQYHITGFCAREVGGGSKGWERGASKPSRERERESLGARSQQTLRPTVPQLRASVREVGAKVWAVGGREMRGGGG